MPVGGRRKGRDTTPLRSENRHAAGQSPTQSRLERRRLLRAPLLLRCPSFGPPYVPPEGIVRVEVTEMLEEWLTGLSILGSRGG